VLLSLKIWEWDEIRLKKNLLEKFFKKLIGKPEKKYITKYKTRFKTCEIFFTKTYF